MKDQVTLSDVFEADLRELLQLEAQAQSGSLTQLYSRLLVLYLQGDVDSLKRHRDWIARIAPEGELSARDREILLSLANLRINVRERSIDPGAVEEALSIAQQEPVWRGEIFFVLGNAYDILGNQELSRLYSREAWKELEAAGAQRKALRALQNAIAADHRLNPERNFLAEYHDIVARAKKLKQFGIAGIALNNLAREYHAMGGPLSALKFSNRAITYLKAEIGSLHYNLALANRAHILADLGREHEARVDLDEMRACKFPEIQAAITVLELILNGKEGRGEAPDEALVPTWRLARERAEKKEPMHESLEALTPLEAQVITLLGQGPKTKIDLITALYGERMDIEVTENRLKNLLSRIRKKRPGLILFTEGRYRIADKLYLRAS